MRGAVADVVVIGGGPSGSAAARRLATLGHSVTILSRRAPTPALAESLPPSADKLLDRLGLADVVDRGPFIRATGNTVYWAGSPRRVEAWAGQQLFYKHAGNVKRSLT